MNELVEVIEVEKANLRNLMGNPFCDNKYNDFISGKIQTLDWVLLQLEIFFYKNQGLRVVILPVNNKGDMMQDGKE